VARPARALVLAAAAALLLLPPPARAQSTGEPLRASVAPAFSGSYRFVLTAAAGCPAGTRVGALSVAVTVTETAVGGGSEVSGVPVPSSLDPARGRFVLQRQGDKLHGPFGASTLEIGLLVLEGTYRLWAQVMADGTATTATGGRSRASGTAFGQIKLSLASDPEGNPIAECDLYKADHQWSLEPM
jgi:hypothetical protein